MSLLSARLGSLLNLLSLFGMPSLNAPRYSPISWSYIKIALTFCFAQLPGLLMLWQLGRDISDISLLSSQFSALDVYILWGAGMISLGFSFTCAHKLKKQRKKLSSLDEKFSAQSLPARRPRRCSTYIFLLEMLASIGSGCFIIAHYHDLAGFTDNYFHNWPFQIGLFMSCFPSTMFGFFHPVLLGTFWVIIFYLICLKEYLNLGTANLRNLRRVGMLQQRRVL